MSMQSFEVSFRDEEAVDKQEKPKNILLGIVFTILALCGGASILPLADEYKEVNILLRTVWRWQIIVIYCLPCGLYFLYLNRKSIDTKKIFSRDTYLEFLAHALLWTVASTFYLWSSDFTLVSHTALLSNMGGVFIVVVNLLRLAPVHRLEIYGTIVVVIFAIIFMNDSSSTKTNGQTNILLGDIMALATTPLYAMYYIVSARLLKKLPTMVILEVSFVFQLIIYFIFYICVMDTDKFYSFDPHFGMLGWASDTYLVFSLVFVGTFSCLLGVGGYVFTLNFFPPHIVGSIFLLEPAFSQSLSCILGQDNMPGIITYLGALGITVGLGISIKGDLLRQKETLPKPQAKNLPKKLDEEESFHSSLIVTPESNQ